MIKIFDTWIKVPNNKWFVFWEAISIIEWLQILWLNHSDSKLLKAKLIIRYNTWNDRFYAKVAPKLLEKLINQKLNNEDKEWLSQVIYEQMTQWHYAFLNNIET